MAPLGNYAVNLSARHASSQSGGADTRAARRERCRALSKADRTRRRLRLVAQQVAPKGSNQAKCGKVLLNPSVALDERYPELGVCVCGVKGQYATFAGLVTCGSAWACPCCAAKIARKRADEVRRAIADCRARGGEVYMGTLTTPHDQADSLKALQRAVADSWSYVLQGRSWQVLKGSLSITGFARGSDDPTVGPRGWHPHLHVLLFCGRPLSQGELETLRRHLYDRWCKRIVGKHGYRKPSQEHGVQITLSHADAYIAKLGLADEVTGGLYKRARDGRRTPLQLLSDAERGDRQALELYAEFVEATHGRKRLTWSTEVLERADGSRVRRSLRARYVAQPEDSDEDVAASIEDERPGPAEERFKVPVPVPLWKATLVDNPEAQSELLVFGRKFGEPGVALYVRWLQALLRTASRRRQTFSALWHRIHDPPPMSLAA